MIQASNEEEYLDNLKKIVDNLFNNYDLSLDDILTKLDSLEQKVALKFGSGSLSRAFIIHKKGVVQYYKGVKGDPSGTYNAIEFYRNALNIRKKLIENDDETIVYNIINGYNNIGDCYLSLGDNYNAIENLIKGLKLLDFYIGKENFTELFIKLNTLSARAYFHIGDLDNALFYYKKIINYSPSDEEIKQLNGEIEIGKIRALLELGGHLAFNFKQPKVAIEYLELAEEKIYSLDSFNTEIFLANTYHNLGNAYTSLNDLNKSLSYYNKSISTNKAINNSLGLADGYINKGVTHFKKDEYDSAKFFLHKADSLYTKLNILHKKYYVSDNLADIAFNNAKFELSLSLDNKSITYIVKNFKPSSIYSNPTFLNTYVYYKKGLLISLESKSTTLLELYYKRNKKKDLEYAFETILLADSVIGSMRSDFLSDGSKLWLAEEAKKVYERALEICYELYSLTHNKKYLNQAFIFSEKSRAIVLLDAIRETKANLNIDKNLQNESRRLNYKVNFLEKQIALSNSNDHLIDSLLFYRRKAAAITDSIKAHHPDYYNMIYGETTATIETAKQMIKPDQMLIEYFTGDSTLYIFAITKDTSLIIQQDLDVSLSKLMETYFNDLNTHDQHFLQTASTLYKYLIKPIKEVVALSEQLIFVPDGELSSLPFETLVNIPPSESRIYFPSYKNYLLYKNQISYLFSVTMLEELRSKNTSPPKTYMGIAPSFDKPIRFHETYFNELQLNTQEIKEAEGIFGGMGLVANKASKEIFIDNAPRYKLLHLATHAKANIEDGDLSFIILGNDSTDILYTKDLYALRLNADMVVLSACQTGSGPLSRGEGNISLARGFTYSGAASVVTSLWNVNEEVNKEIVNYYYQGIKNGLPKDKALQEAKIKFLSTITREDQAKAHPFYWAPLICIGDVEPIQTNKQRIWVPVLIVLLLSVVLYLIRRKV